MYEGLVLGFTGTRLGPRPAQTAAIRWFVKRLEPFRFIHGGASGADMIAHGIAESLWIPFIDIYPSDHPSPGLGVLRPHVTIHAELPPLERNKVIVRRVWGLLACPAGDIEELRSSTWATVREARKIDCPVYLIRADGRIERDIDPAFA